MDFSLTTMYVVPTGNTLPTGSNTSASLTSGQVGVFLPDNTAATVANVGTAKYIYFAQGRNIYSPIEGTKKSDHILPKNLISWYKVTGSLEQNTQVTTISNLNVGCNEDVTITLRLHSFYIDTAYFNGLTRSVLVTTPCCNCGSNPCDTLQASDLQLTMELLAEAINNDEILSNFVTAGVDGTGASTVIYIQGLTLQQYGSSCDLTNFPYQFDRMWFRTFMRTGPELTTDYEVDDYCNTVSTISIIQKASYPQLTPAEIQQMEKDNWYNQADYKSIFSNPNYNGEFLSYVDSALAYDCYYLKFYRPGNEGWNAAVQIDETVILAFPQGDSGETNMVAILTAMFGPADNDIATPSTTTTYTTSSTTTTTTTNVTP